MEINQYFFDKIEPVLKWLKEKIGNDFVVFGSGPLYLMGVVEFGENSALNDLDIAIKDLAVVPKEAKEVHFRGDLNQKLFKINIQGIDVDMGAVWPGQEEIFPKIFKDPFVVQDYKFANLQICLEWREYVAEKYKREKDIVYLTKIKEFIKNKN